MGSRRCLITCSHQRDCIHAVFLPRVCTNLKCLAHQDSFFTCTKRSPVPVGAPPRLGVPVPQIAYMTHGSYQGAAASTPRIEGGKGRWEAHARQTYIEIDFRRREAARVGCRPILASSSRPNYRRGLPCTTCRCYTPDDQLLLPGRGLLMSDDQRVNVNCITNSV